MSLTPHHSKLAAFAEHYRLRVKRDGCGDLIIPGRGHIYDHGDGGRLGVCLMFPTKMRWTYAKKKLAAAGFTIRQDAETEGTALFDPSDSKQGRLAIRMVGARRIRQVLKPTDAQLRARALFSARARAGSEALVLGTTQEGELVSHTSGKGSDAKQST